MTCRKQGSGDPTISRDRIPTYQVVIPSPGFKGEESAGEAKSRFLPRRTLGTLTAQSVAKNAPRNDGQETRVGRPLQGAQCATLTGCLDRDRDGGGIILGCIVRDVARSLTLPPG